MPTEFDMMVLRAMNGEDVPELNWGAAMSETLGSLVAQGLARRSYSETSVRYDITDAGRVILDGKKP